MNDKKVIETYKSVRAVEQSQPQPLKPEDVVYIQNMIEDGSIKVQANPQPEARSLVQIILDIENDKNKSRALKDFEIHLAQMAERMTHSKTALPVSNNNTSQPEQANERLQRNNT